MPCVARMLRPLTVISRVRFPAAGSIDTTVWRAASSSSTRAPLRRTEYCAATGDETSSAVMSVSVRCKFMSRCHRVDEFNRKGTETQRRAHAAVVIRSAEPRQSGSAKL